MLGSADPVRSGVQVTGSKRNLFISLFVGIREISPRNRKNFAVFNQTSTSVGGNDTHDTLPKMPTSPLRQRLGS